MTPLVTCSHTSESSSSKPMDKRIRSDSVLALGKKIVDELGPDQSVDTLARWMAHYIAETMEDAEAATGEARKKKMSECNDLILKLWAHRSKLSNGKRPFEDFEPIFRVLKSLDLDDTISRFFLKAKLAADLKDEDELVAQWLNRASELDYAARMLIRYCLASAAQEAVDKSRDWVALADAITEKDDIDIKIIHSITNDVDDLNTEKPDDSKKRKIEDLLKRLEAFTDLSNELSSHFRQQLEQTAP